MKVTWIEFCWILLRNILMSLDLCVLLCLSHTVEHSRLILVTLCCRLDFRNSRKLTLSNLLWFVWLCPITADLLCFHLLTSSLFINNQMTLKKAKHFFCSYTFANTALMMPKNPDLLLWFVLCKALNVLKRILTEI